MPSRGKHLTLTIASVAVLVLGVATWQAWPSIQFWWRFESLGPNAQGLPEYRHRATGIVMVRVPGGTFHMGSPEDEPYRVQELYDESDEGPIHEVRLSRFLIGKFEVTQCEWHSIVGNYPAFFDGTKDWDGNPVNPPDNRDRLPVEGVSWEDIQQFQEKTGLTLPTEAQWEYSCRGGTTTAFSFGSGESCADWESTPCSERDVYMWYSANSARRPHEVGMKPPNPFGLHDMHGNVWEWCQDMYDEGFYSTAPAKGPDPVCTSGTVYRVTRGGSWEDYASSCRSALRFWDIPWNRMPAVGFRVAAPCP